LVFAILQIEAILKQEHLHQFFYKSCPAHGGRRNANINEVQKILLQGGTSL
jgi:hypothetical protein